MTHFSYVRSGVRELQSPQLLLRMSVMCNTAHLHQDVEKVSTQHTYTQHAYIASHSEAWMGGMEGLTCIKRSSRQLSRLSNVFCELTS